MAKTTDPGTPKGNKGRRYAEQVLDESFFGERPPWVDVSRYYLLSLHAGKAEGEDGRLTAEIRYPGYESAAIVRSRQGWQRSGNVTSNLDDIRFALYQDGPLIVARSWALTPAGFDAPAYTGEFDTAIEIKPGTRPVIDAGTIRVREV